MNRHAGRRRRAGIALIGFGASGIALVVAAAALVLGSLSAVDDAVSGFERQRAEVVALLGPASSALSNAATSASNASASLTQTGAAAAQAAMLSSRLAGSFEGLAALGAFEILGARPFGALSGQFGEVATEARALSTDLSAAAEALRTNIADSTSVASDLRLLAGRLTSLEASLGSSGAPNATNAALPVGLARLVLLGLLAWLAVPAVVTLWLGRRLLRSSRSGGRIPS